MHSPTRARRVIAGSVAAIAALLLIQACSSGAHVAGRSTTVARPAPGKPEPRGQLYAYPDEQLYATAAQLAHNEKTIAVADALMTIARTPSAYWAAGQAREMQHVRQITQEGTQAQEIPVIVAYHVPDRDACGKFSATPASSVRGYETWVNQLAAAIGAGRDIVIVEPDALPDIVRGCLDTQQATQRYSMLHYAMSRLGGLPHTYVYLDAGNPGMFANPQQLVQPLIRAGIRDGRGFSANVSNFQWTNTMIAWSQRLESALGGDLGAVIDTSRNGNGPYTGPDNPQWCNPPDRSPGPAPKTQPGPAGIDAYLWIKNPGASDGACNGGPPAGQYWSAYAEGLAIGAMHE